MAQRAACSASGQSPMEDTVVRLLSYLDGMAGVDAPPAQAATQPICRGAGVGQ